MKITLFKELSQIFKDHCGKLKDFSRISPFLSIFKAFLKDMMPFQGLFKARGNHEKVKLRSEESVEAKDSCKGDNIT